MASLTLFMEDATDKAQVGQMVHALGYEPFPVPPRPGVGESCDLIAVRDDERIAVEIKSRGDPSAVATALRSGEIASGSLTVTADATAGKRMAKAHRQTSASTVCDGFSVLWYRCLSRGFGDVRAEQVRGEAFGAAKVVVWNEGDARVHGMDCFFVRRPKFKDVPNLNGIVLEEAEGISLLVNPFSPSATQFSSSHLARFFRERGAALEPLEHGCSDTFLVANPSIAWVTQVELEAFLCQKYGFAGVTCLDLRRHFAVSAVIPS